MYDAHPTANRRDEIVPHLLHCDEEIGDRSAYVDHEGRNRLNRGLDRLAVDRLHPLGDGLDGSIDRRLQHGEDARAERLDGYAEQRDLLVRCRHARDGSGKTILSRMHLLL